MNYIKLLNAAFEKFYFDDRLNPTHISLYMAFFQEWNSSRFADVFFVNRKEMMLMSKIGSTSTYHRCVTELHTWEYLRYFPSRNPFKGSKIRMSILETRDEPVTEHYDPILEQLAEQYSPKNEPLLNRYHPINEQVLVPYTNNTKQQNNIKQPKDGQAVINFFQKKGFSAVDAQKFFHHYQTSQWTTSDGESIRNWKAVAVNWMDNAGQFEEEKTIKKGINSSNAYEVRDHLKTKKIKNYGQPL
ncbi:MAG: hypothetical protein WCD31_12060 [Gillisia sp.]